LESSTWEREEFRTSLSHVDLTNRDYFLEGTPHGSLTEIRNQDPVHRHEGSSLRD